MRKAENLPPSCAVVTKSRNLKFLEPSGLVQICNGSALPYLYVVSPGSKLLVHWDGPGTSNSATVGEGNRLLELGVRGPDTEACHYISYR